MRRAYLRAVRRHPAERDPEGFQRVRAAYELLQRFVAAPPTEPSSAAGALSDAPAPVVVARLPSVDPPRPVIRALAVEVPAQAVREALRARHPVKAARLFQERVEALTSSGAFAVHLGDDIALALLAAGKTRSARAHVAVVDRLVAQAGLAGQIGDGHEGLVHAAIRDLVALTHQLTDHEIAALAGAVSGSSDPRTLGVSSRVRAAIETTPALAALLPPPPPPAPEPAETRGWRPRWLWFAPLLLIGRLFSSRETGNPRHDAPGPVVAQPVPPTPPNATPQNAGPTMPESTLDELKPSTPPLAPLGLPNLPLEPESFMSVGRALAKEGLNLQHATLYTLGMDLRQTKDCAAAIKTRTAIAREIATQPALVAAAKAAIAFVDRTCGTAHP
ncbi:MAG: hypothetical protein IPJ34_28430 [Myxococcales bacterium]|nr:hypothetical protein [Myxococcales bacterium]